MLDFIAIFSPARLCPTWVLIYFVSTRCSANDTIVDEKRPDWCPEFLWNNREDIVTIGGALLVSFTIRAVIAEVRSTLSTIVVYRCARAMGGVKYLTILIRLYFVVASTCAACCAGLVFTVLRFRGDSP